MNAPQTETRLGRHGRLSDAERTAFEDATRLFPGGVLGGNTLPEGGRFVFTHGTGARFWDMSGNEYIDYVLGSGALFLGHAHPAIQAAVTAQAAKGTHTFAYLNQTAVELARRLQPLVRCAERLRFTTSGSDSTFHAIRLARAFTGREKILKFEGAYHGTHDYAQMSTAPTEALPFPTPRPDSAGIPGVVRDLTMVAQWNDLDLLQQLLDAHGHEIAAVILEPIQRILWPAPGFLAAVRELTLRHGCLMILDEVVTGLRYGLGGAQDYFDVTPDLATYGKIVGGGLPVGAVMGRADVMDQADPGQKGQSGYVYQNGTLQGHPLGCAAGLATLDVLAAPGVYEATFAMADRLRHGLQEVFDRRRMDMVVFGQGPMWHFLCGDKVPQTYRDIAKTDLKRLKRIEAEMIRNGLFVLPNNRRFISITHTDDDLAATFEAVDRACVTVRDL